jgi:hypothetical protein
VSLPPAASALAPDPLGGLVRDLLAGVEQIGRAAVGQERIRLAVTGLTRAGKTVFLTSVVANLLAAGRGSRTLPALQDAAGGRLLGARLVPAGAEAVPRFDVHGHLAALARDPPAWPDRTDDLATLDLVLEVARAAPLAGLLGPRSVTLELLDYPGEWLLDLPMLEETFEDWSAATLARLRAPERLAATGPFLAFLAALPAAAPGEEALARRGFGLYREALRACRDALGLRFLQPGRALNPGPRGDAPLLWFFPLPAEQQGDLAALLRRRHAAYVADQQARFFEPFFRRFQRQAVLVDVLGALHAGPAAFADTAEALGAIAGALRARDGWLARLLGLETARIAFVATKADHVPAGQRAALLSLLGALIGAPRQAAAAAGTATGAHALAALRCTVDDVAAVDGQEVPVVRGFALAEDRALVVYPGEVPSHPPDPAAWPHFTMPAFRPPRLDASGQAGAPHLGVDAVLAWLIGDLL